MAGTVSIKITDHIAQTVEEVTASIEKALEICGSTAEAYAKMLCPVDTGNLRNNISHTVENEGGEFSAYIGSPTEYAPYVELGTGQYYPGGRPTPWAYEDEKGNWHYTSGNKPQPFMKPAISDHVDQYKQIISATLAGDL